jgi:4-amino-4-deoxy-L-arabinose transferase-like glycosyltransferase
MTAESGKTQVCSMLTKSSTPIIPLIVAVVCLVPFVNKAFHMDDPLFLWTAKQIQSKPADFYGFSVNWYGREMPMAEVMKNPPLASYYIAMVASLFGFSETALHIAFLVPAVGAVLGTYYLARRLSPQPALAAVLMLLTPAFLVSSTNVMCDTMMLALWIWAVFLWVRGIKTDSNLNLFFAAFLIAICALTKYFGMSLLVLLFAYSLMQKRRPGMWVLFLFIPVVILVRYQWLTYTLYGRGLLSNAADYAIWESKWTGISQFLLKGLIGLVFTGGCIITVLFYSTLLWSRRVLIWAGAATILLIIALIFAGKVSNVPTYTNSGVKWGFVVQFGLMCATGAGILWLSGADFWKHRDADSLLLLLWVFGTFVFTGFVNWTINARSVLPMVPAVTILLVRRINYRRKPGAGGKTWRMVWPLVAAAVVALSVCWADYVFAGAARSAAASVHDRFQNYPGTVWFEGHWGFQYYMEAAGAKAIDFKHKNLTLTRQDIVVIPRTNTNMSPPTAKVASLEDVLLYVPFPLLATMNPVLGAGFYSNDWGALPFAIGPVSAEKYYIYTVK